MIVPLIMLMLMTAPLALLAWIEDEPLSEWQKRNAAAFGLTLLFSFTGIFHFVHAEAMSHMVPFWLPDRLALVYLTGALELALAAGFLFASTRRLTGWIALCALLVFFPSNIYAAFNEVPLGGHAWGPSYLLVRAPLQALMLMWVWRFVLSQASLPRGATGGRCEIRTTCQGIRTGFEAGDSTSRAALPERVRSARWRRIAR